MSLYKDKFKIVSNRLQEWDYSSEAVYFITLVTRNRKCLFGSVEDEKMILNDNGKIIENELLKSIKIRKNWFFHNWIVMPNHIHLLIKIQNSDVSIEIQNPNAQIVETHGNASTSSISETLNVAETDSSPSLQNQSTSIFDKHNVETHGSASTSSISVKKNETESKFGRKSNSISSFVAIFKSITTKQINDAESIWQTNYHDHIVRNYKTFDTIYNYIKENPRSWDTDSINSNFQ